MSDQTDTETKSNREQISRERYDVYVQWQRGEPHQHEETIRASDSETALTLAKRNVDVRLEPLNLRVVPRAATKSTKLDDPTLTPGTDRSYRNAQGYPSKEVNPPNKQEASVDTDDTRFTQS